MSMLVTLSLSLEPAFPCLDAYRFPVFRRLFLSLMIPLSGKPDLAFLFIDAIQKENKQVVNLLTQSLASTVYNS